MTRWAGLIDSLLIDISPDRQCPRCPSEIEMEHSYIKGKTTPYSLLATAKHSLYQNKHFSQKKDTVECIRTYIAFKPSK